MNPLANIQSVKNSILSEFASVFSIDYLHQLDGQSDRIENSIGSADELSSSALKQLVEYIDIVRKQVVS